MELMKQYLDSQNFTSTTQIVQAMKELFHDAIEAVYPKVGIQRCIIH